MKKVFLALAATAMLFVGCSKDDDDGVDNLNEKIIGKWKTTQVDGQDALTNSKVVLTFESPTKAFMSAAISTNPEIIMLWDAHEEVACAIDDDIVTLTQDLNEHIKVVVTLKVTSISDSKMKAKFSQIVYVDGAEAHKIPERKIEYTKVNVDYTQQVVGKWECVEMTGDETYNDDNAQLDFKADGTYDYYRLEDGEWTLVPRVLNEYNIDGNWFATRWQEAGTMMLYEWWDIESLSNNEMVWTGLRQKNDGTRFTTTYRWQKVQ